MKIAKLETFYVPPRWLFVRLESDEGVVGWGEASLEGYAEAVEGALEAKPRSTARRQRSPAPSRYTLTRWHTIGTQTKERGEV